MSSRGSDRADAWGPEPLFPGVSSPISEPDPSFLAHGFVRPTAEPSGKSLEPDLAAPINLAFRLRHLLGVSARAEAARYLLTADAPRATVAAVASSAGYTKRNVQEALASLHASGAAGLVTIGVDQRFGVDRGRWAHLLEIDPGHLPIHRDWPQLLGGFRKVLRWLERPELPGLSDYLRASQARDLLDDVRPALAHAGIVASARRGGEGAWDGLVDTVDAALLALAPQPGTMGGSAGFEAYQDAGGQHRWRLKAADGRIIAISPEGYASEQDAERAARSARDLASAAG